MTEVRFAADMLKSYVSRVEELERHIAEFNSDKSDIFKEAKSNGFDVKALKSVIAYRRKDPVERDAHESLVATYLHALEGKSDSGTPVATRARTTPSAKVSIAAGTPEPAEKPIRSIAEIPAPPSKTASALQASVAMARAGADPFEMPDIPAGLDRRPA